jgi:hypothetical protein
MRSFLTLIILLSFYFKLHAQQNWDTYVTKYGDRPGSVMLNMSLKRSAPDSTLPFLFAAGVRFNECTGKGLPTPIELLRLNIISDSVIAIVNRNVKNKLAGTFTFQCVRRDYFYVKDTAGLREKVSLAIYKNFPNYGPAFHVKRDDSWDAYINFLYPNDSTLKYMKQAKIPADN